MSKIAYIEHNVIDEIFAALSVILEERGKATPTDVLRLLNYEETPLTRSMVRDTARMIHTFDVNTSGRDYVITANFFNDDIPF